MQSAASTDKNIAQEFRDYAYSVSHDLSAPVRAMVEFSRLLTEEQAASLSEDSRLYLSLIIENGETLQKMIDGLLAYSRLNTAAMPFSRLDCNALLEACVEQRQAILILSGGRVEITPLPAIDADHEQMLTLFAALLDNALKFHLPGIAPHIRISAQAKAEEWEFAIADNGIGIDAKFGQKVFQPFQRLHTAEEYPGTGMGLALAKKIVGRHGGRIWFESGKGRGATFFFTLPRKE